MKRTIKRLLAIGLIAGSLYLAPKCQYELLAKIQDNCAQNSPQIKTKEQAEQKINYLRKELGMRKDALIDVEFYQDDVDRIVLEGPIHYKIKLVENNVTECDLKHEMYHGTEGHLESIMHTKNPMIKSMKKNWYEFTATLYQAYDIRL